MNLPKVELHVHLEGTAPPSLIRRLAERNHIAVPEHLFASEAMFNWTGFPDFLATYEAASQVIKQPRDYYDVTYEYLKACAAEGAIYVEMMYSPEHAQRASGIPSHEHLLAIQDAIDNAERELSIIGRILITCVRHYGVDCAVKVARQATQETVNCIVGFGMGGDEINFPAAQFKPAYQIAHAAGLACTTHAGEFCGPAGIIDALDHLPLQRLGHGVRAIEDPNLIERLIRENITLEVCPGSNIALGVYPDFASHPLLKLLNAGVKLTLNSDDPPYFNTSIGKEYQIAQDIFGLNQQQLLNITRTGIMSGFGGDSVKSTCHNLLAQFVHR